MSNFTIHHGDALAVLKTLPSESVQTCVTSPPYWSLRDYGVEGQIGLEDTPEAFVSRLADVFDEVRRVLKKDGTLWLNLGDSYAGHNSQASNNGRAGLGNPRERIVARFADGLKGKDLVGIPWLTAFELRKRGWWLRQDIIWAKPNPMPESVTDRCTKAHEYIFLLSKSQTYFFDHEAIQEEANYDGRKDTLFKGGVHSGKEWTPQTKGRDRSLPRNRNGITGSLDHKNVQHKGQEPNTFHLNGLGGTPDEIYAVRNKRSVWNVNLKPFADAHFATFPEKLIEPCILAGSRPGDTVLDPFNGAGTTGLVSLKHHRNYIGIELNPEYIKIAEKRLSEVQVNLF